VAGEAAEGSLRGRLRMIHDVSDESDLAETVVDCWENLTRRANLSLSERLVRETGVEPARPFGHKILSILRIDDGKGFMLKCVPLCVLGFPAPSGLLYGDETATIQRVTLPSRPRVAAPVFHGRPSLP
jgi:hypothetical protein